MIPPSRRDLELAVYRLASTMSDHLPLRGANKDLRGEVHLDMEKALDTFMRACQEQARLEARKQVREILQGFLETSS